MSRPRGRGFGGGRGRGSSFGPPQRQRNTSKLFIGNMPDTVRRADLKELFEKFGEVVECDIVKDYAFVHYNSVKEAEEAVKNLHETDFQGSNIRVELSHSHVRTKPGMGDKDECFRCGRIGHWSKDCPKAPPSRRGDPSSSRDRGASRGRGGRDSERDSYSRDPYAREGYSTRDPYSRGLFAERDQYERNPYARDPYARERLPEVDRYRAAASLRYDPYARRLPPARELPVARETYKDPYARPPPDYYKKAVAERDSYAADPYALARLPPR